MFEGEAEERRKAEGRRIALLRSALSMNSRAYFPHLVEKGVCILYRAAERFIFS